MGFPLIFIGLLLIIVAARDKTKEFEELIADDFFGGGEGPGFIGWIVAVLVLAALGSFKPLRQLSDAFLGLIAMVLILSNRGFFAEFQRQALGKPEYVNKLRE